MAGLVNTQRLQQPWRHGPLAVSSLAVAESMYLTFYPHTPIGKVWIYRLLLVFFCLFVRLRISPPRIDLAASRRFIAFLGRESPILGNFTPPEVPPEAQNGVYAFVEFIWVFDHTRGPCAWRFVQRAGNA